MPTCIFTGYFWPRVCVYVCPDALISSQVLRLRSVENVHLVLHIDQDFGFTQDRVCHAHRVNMLLGAYIILINIVLLLILFLQYYCYYYYLPTALYGAKAWGMRSAERRKVNVHKMKCLRSLVGVTRIDGVRNEEVGSRTGIGRELASRADQRVMKWFGHVDEWMSLVWPKGCGGRIR